MTDEARAVPQGACASPSSIGGESGSGLCSGSSARTGDGSRVAAIGAAETKAYGRRLHAERSESVPAQPGPPDFDGHAELASAWRSLQLEWLRTLPGYREQLRQRVSEARLRARQADLRRERGYRSRSDVDELGREIEGCG